MNAKPTKKRKATNIPHLPTLIAPYELQAAAKNYQSTKDWTDKRPVTREHGGYGVVTEGYITGPFFCYENAERTSERLIGACVVRWTDFITQSTRDGEFARHLAKAKEPITTKIRGYMRQVSITNF
jgi:hypothetical protein